MINRFTHQLNDLVFFSLLALRLLNGSTAMMAQSESQSEKTADLRSVHTSNLPEIFEQLGISLIVSTYQAGKAIVVRTDVTAQSSNKLVSDFD